MAATPLFEGTLEELFHRRDEFAGIRLAVFAAPAEELDLPTPLTTIRDRAHLEELLLVGVNSPKQKVTEDTWEHIRQEVRNRLEAEAQRSWSLILFSRRKRLKMLFRQPAICRRKAV